MIPIPPSKTCTKHTLILSAGVYSLKSALNFTAILISIDTHEGESADIFIYCIHNYYTYTYFTFHMGLKYVCDFHLFFLPAQKVPFGSEQCAKVLY